MDRDWNNEASLALIRQYRSQPILWNTRHGYHYSKVRKQEAWETIAYNMQVGVSEVRQKMNSLLGSFRRERARMKKGEGYGNFSSKWFAFESMAFLLDRHETYSNANGSDYFDQSDDKVYLEQLQVKLEGGDEDDLALDSDSNHLLEEELSEAAEDTPTPKPKQTETSYPSQTPPAKRMKLKHSNHPTISTTTFPMQDECTMYGHYLSSKLRNMSSRTRSFVERAISNVLFEADMGKYDGVPPLFGTKEQTPPLLSPHLDGMDLFPHSPTAEETAPSSDLTDADVGLT